MKLMILTMLMLQSSNTTDILIVIKTGIVSGRFVFLSAILFICCGSVFQLLKFQLVALTPVLKAGRFYRYIYIYMRRCIMQVQFCALICGCMYMHAQALT